MLLLSHQDTVKMTAGKEYRFSWWIRVKDCHNHELSFGSSHSEIWNEMNSSNTLFSERPNITSGSKKPKILGLWKVYALSTTHKVKYSRIKDSVITLRHIDVRTSFLVLLCWNPRSCSGWQFRGVSVAQRSRLWRQWQRNRLSWMGRRLSAERRKEGAQVLCTGRSRIYRRWLGQNPANSDGDGSPTGELDVQDTSSIRTPSGRTRSKDVEWVSLSVEIVNPRCWSPIIFSCLPNERCCSEMKVSDTLEITGVMETGQMDNHT